MDEQIRKNALRAAARVALGITALGATTGVTAACGGGLAPVRTDDAYLIDEPPHEDGSDILAAADAACDAPADGGGADCEKVLADAAADPAFAELLEWRFEKPVSMPPISDELRACCDADLHDPAFRFGGRVLCCNVAGDGITSNGGAAGCTPWGPAVPPAMFAPLEVA